MPSNPYMCRSIGSGYDLSIQRQALSWASTELFSIRPSGTNLSEIRIETKQLSSRKMHLDMSREKCQPVRSGSRLNIKMSSYQYRDPHVKDNTVFILRQGPGLDVTYHFLFKFSLFYFILRRVVSSKHRKPEISHQILLQEIVILQ